MKDWIIQRYNKNHDYFNAYNYYKNKGIYIEIGVHIDDVKIISLYDFLFNQKWGFAKTFWGEEKCDCSSMALQLNQGCKGTNCKKGWKYHLQQMVISDDPIKYLEQFKA
jgi:hypothetical protein